MRLLHLIKTSLLIIFVIFLAIIISGCLSQKEKTANNIIDKINSENNGINYDIQNLEKIDKEIDIEENDLSEFCLEFEKAANITENRKIIYKIENKIEELTEKNRQNIKRVEEIEKKLEKINSYWKDLKKIETPLWISKYTDLQQYSLNMHAKAVEKLLSVYSLRSDFYQESQSFFINLDNILIEINQIKFEDEEAKNNFYNQRMKLQNQNYNKYLQSKEKILKNVFIYFDKADSYQEEAAKVYKKNI